MIAEPLTVKEPGTGGRDGVFTLTKGPVSVTVLYSQEDRAVLDPRRRTSTTADLIAWEEGEVFDLWLSHHDGEGDAGGPTYGMKDAEMAAIEALEYGWQRYVDAIEALNKRDGGHHRCDGDHCNGIGLTRYMGEPCAYCDDMDAREDVTA